MSSQPTLIAIASAKEPIPGRYIVTVREGVSLASRISSIQGNVTHELEIINGFAGEFTEDDLNVLRANPEIEAIEQDGLACICGHETQSVLPPASSLPI